MNKKEIATLKEKVRTDFENRIQELRDELNKQLEAIDIVAGIVAQTNGETNNKQMQQTTTTPAPNVAGQKIMLQVMDQCPLSFSMHDGKMVCEEKFPDFSFSRNSWHNTVKKKKMLSEIEEIQAGTGRAPSVYHKTDKYRPFEETE